VAFNNWGQMISAEETDGKTFFSTWRKTPSPTTSRGIWFDLSTAPGNPVPNYYIGLPLTATALAQSTDGGIFHGPKVGTGYGGYTKYLKTFAAISTLATAAPLPAILCDYLLFYPFADMSTTDQQLTTNTTTIPRYTDGAGVQIMAIEVNAQSGASNPQFYLTYTNSDGVSGRTTPPVACNTQTVYGTLINTAPATARCNGPFIPLQPGDTGVRSIDSVNFLQTDIGLVTFVLVKPIDSLNLVQTTAWGERQNPIHFSKLPVIKDDAYLNLICTSNGTLAAAPMHGYIQTIWG